MKARLINKSAWLIVLLVGLFNTNLHAQGGDDEFVLISKPTIVYWHYVNIIFRVDRRSGITEYILRPSGSAYHEGDERGFTKALWRESRRLRLAVGPFWDLERSRLANEMYRTSAGRYSISMPYKPGEIAYWYYIKVEQGRSGYRWTTTDSDISQGTVEQFYNALPLGLEQGILAVGPFRHRFEVEDSKRIFSE